MMSQSSGRRGIAWALVGGLVLIAGIVAIIVSAMLAQPAPTPSDTPTASNTPEPTASDQPDGSFVDPTAADQGWTPEPITTEADTYIRAALAAASTFDTTKSTREEWIDYLDTWFTPDTRFTAEADQLAAMSDSQTELRQGVVLPQEEWDSLAGENGRVVAVVTGDIADVPVTDDPSGDMSIGIAWRAGYAPPSPGQPGPRISVDQLQPPAELPTWFHHPSGVGYARFSAETLWLIDGAGRYLGETVVRTGHGKWATGRSRAKGYIFQNQPVITLPGAPPVSPFQTAAILASRALDTGAYAGPRTLADVYRTWCSEERQER